jgi:aspartate--ammonia ligase
MSTLVLDRKADLAGPGIGDYTELEKILPPVAADAQRDAAGHLSPAALHRRQPVQGSEPDDGRGALIVDVESGINDMLERDGSRTPIQFHISNDRNQHPVDAQVVQAANKWKRTALKQFDCRPGQGIYTDMRAVRKDYFLDNDRSAYVDQWDWERAITAEQRNLDFLKAVVNRIDICAKKDIFVLD